MSDLLTRCVDSYWKTELNIRGIHSNLRMAAVFKELADEIRKWAPDKATAKICHLAVNEVADRLLEEAAHGNPQPQPASSGHQTP